MKAGLLDVVEAKFVKKEPAAVCAAEGFDDFCAQASSGALVTAPALPTVEQPEVFLVKG